MSFNSKYTGAQVEAWLDNIKNYSANDILEKVKTVDGSGSGLDADLLDGIQSSGYGQYVNDLTINLNDAREGFRGGKLYNATNAYDSTDAAYRGFLEYGSRGYRAQFNSSSSNNLYYRWCEANIWKPWRKVAFEDSNVASATYAPNTSKLYSTDNIYSYGSANPYYGYLTYNQTHNEWDFKVTPNTLEFIHVNSCNKLRNSRTIWGQSFDGTGDVDGKILLTSWDNDGVGLRFHNNTKGVAYISMYAADGNAYLFGQNGNRFLINHNAYGDIFNIVGGNVGIGTDSPSYKLDVSGSIHASGSITQNSDINLKNISKDILISLDDIAEAPLFEFTYKSDKDKRIHVGTSAQYWVEKNNWFCKKQDNGYYDMEIQNLSLASAISIAKEFKKYKEETDSTISSMKNEIKELKQLVLNMNK